MNAAKIASAGVAISSDTLMRPGSRYTACAGASIHLGHATVALRGVHGIVRLRSDLRALDGAAGRGSPRSDRPERSSITPPAVPPRR